MSNSNRVRVRRRLTQKSYLMRLRNHTRHKLKRTPHNPDKSRLSSTLSRVPIIPHRSRPPNTSLLLVPNPVTSVIVLLSTRCTRCSVTRQSTRHRNFRPRHSSSFNISVIRHHLRNKFTSDSSRTLCQIVSFCHQLVRASRYLPLLTRILVRIHLQPDPVGPPSAAVVLIRRRRVVPVLLSFVSIASVLPCSVVPSGLASSSTILAPMSSTSLRISRISCSLFDTCS